MLKQNKKIIEIGFLFLLSLTPLLWFQDSQMLLGHDAGFRLNVFQHLKNLFFSWNPSINYGFDWSIFKGFLIIQAPETLFSLLTGSVVIGQRMALVFWFFISGLGMYIFINSFFPKKEFWIIRIFSSAFYMFNFFLLQAWFIAERSKFSLYALLPLGLLIIWKTIYKEYPIIKGAILFSLISVFLNGGGNPPLYGAVLLVYVITFIYLTIMNVIKDGFKEIFYSVKIVGGFIIGFILINAYWIFPQVYLIKNKYSGNLSSLGGIEGILGWERIISKNASFINIFRLQGITDWYDNAFHPYANYFLTNSYLIILSFIPILIILLGLTLYDQFDIKYKQAKLLNLIIIFFFVGAVFTGGTHPPVGFIYEFLVVHIPFFAIFRSSFYKFSPILFFSIIFLTGYFLNFILIKYIKSKKLYFFSGIAAIALLLFYHFPFFTNNFFIFSPPFTTKVTIPTYVNDMFAYITNTDPEARILLLPELDSSLYQDSYQWGYWSLDILPRIALTNPVIAQDFNNANASQLYAAINRGDENTFLKLADMTGIKKILWRGDVLYNDKTTRSEDLISEDIHLNQFKSVHLDKSLGKWKLYTISLPDRFSLFNTPQTFNYINSPISSVGNFIQINGDINKDINYITNDSLAKNYVHIQPFVNKEIIRADCVVCDANVFQDMENGIVMPPVRFLPWSKLYFLVSDKEKKTLASAPPGPRIDDDLSYSNRRLVEIWRMAYKDFSAKTPEYTAINTEKYKESIIDALLQDEKLSEIDKNSYLIRILVYLRFQKRYIQFFNETATIKNSVNDLLAFMDQKISDINQKVWTSTSNADRKFYVTISHDGIYDLLVNTDNNMQASILIDYKRVEDIHKIHLISGLHKLEMIFPELENLLVSQDGSSFQQTYTLHKNSPLQFTISKFDAINTYVVSFEYKLQGGTKADFSITQNNKDGNWKSSLRTPYITRLSGDNVWHTISYTYNPHVGTHNAFLTFIGKNNSENIEFKNFSVQKLLMPNIYLVRELNANHIQVPTISFKNNNPSNYIITIKNAKAPFVLTFDQIFDPGWKAYILDPDNSFSKNLKRVNVFNKAFLYTIFHKPINENDHFKLNDYKNGWYINKEGNFSIIIEYSPQRYFYVGLIISLITVLTMIFLLSKEIYEKRKKYN